MEEVIIQQIEQIFTKHKLLGNHDFTEDEYSLMVNYVSGLCNRFVLNNSNSFVENTHKLILVTLVEIAKRWKDKSDTAKENEENSGFWKFIFKALIGKEKNDQRLYGAFTALISHAGSQQMLPIVKTGKKYYATLMMHSFAPENSVHSFFDLCYNVFKKDLDYGFTSDDEWLCEIVAMRLKTVLGGRYSEDEKVSIGSSAYLIKIGLRSFALNEDLSADFVEFIKNTFYQINKLFNREKINESTRLKRYIVEWWKNKTETEKVSGDNSRKKRIATVSKQNIVAKYIRENDKVFLCIPSIRLDDNNDKVQLSVYVNDENVYSEEMQTKRGELVVATKQKEFDLNELLKCSDSINVRIEIKENGAVIFDSEKNKTTLLNREFILFDDENEVFSQINKPTNYFVYSKNIDALKSIPTELTTYGINIYNIYPNIGETLKGETKQVFFVNKEKSASLGKNVCLIGDLTNVEWLLDDISCVVYGNSIKLMIPDNLNLKALELKIDNKSYKLHDLKYEQLENNCYKFGLKALRLIAENEPIEISLYSYEKQTALLTENVILLPSLDIQFNKPFYYGDIERKVIIINDNDRKELSWTNQESEIKCPLNEGLLLVKIPYFRWRKNNNEWHNEPINRKLWYKDFFANGDLLEIDNPKENKTISIRGKTDETSFEITKNQSGKFEIGRAIYANERRKNISVYFSDSRNEKIELFKVATKEHFIDTPLIYRNGKVCWDVENTFIGDKNNVFFLIIKSHGNHDRNKVGATNMEFDNFDEDIYNVIVKIRDKNIFSKEDKYDIIFEGKLLVGSFEKLRFKNKKIKLLSANCCNGKSSWISFFPKYFIDELQLVQEDENVYYSGRLCVIDQNGETRVLNTMKNEKGNYDKINPIRIELRDNGTLWLVAGWEGGNNFIGNLFCDKKRKGICNIAEQNALYDEINLYKFKEEEYV